MKSGCAEARASGREYEDSVYFNPYTSEYLGNWQYGVNKSFGEWIIWLQVPLHSGTSWGLGVKLVWAPAGLAVPLLMITRLLIYWNRSLRKKSGDSYGSTGMRAPDGGRLRQFHQPC